jgi:hypothetical protein
MILRRSPGLRAAVGLGGRAALGGCGDLDTGPAVAVGSEDPVVSLHFSERLPSLPSLAERWAPGLGLEPILASWHALLGVVGRSRRADSSGGGRCRRRDHGRRGSPDGAGPGLSAGGRSDSCGRGGPGNLLRRGFVGVAGEREAGDLLLLSGPLATAAEHRDRARAAREAGDAESLLRHLLLASDALRSTTAEALALVFIEQADVGLRRISESDAYAQVTVERVERLLSGAREALDVGQAPLALQRAWYAVGLLRASEALGGVDPDQAGPGTRGPGSAAGPPGGDLIEENG